MPSSDHVESAERAHERLEARRRGEPEWTVETAIEQIERCDFECIAGPLTNNVAWRWLKEHVK